MSIPTGGDDLNGLLAAMSQLLKQLTNAENDANTRTVIGSAAQGRVTITASGEFSFDSVTIDPAVIDIDDLSLVEDLVLAALRDAVTQLKAVRKAAMGGAVSEALSGLFGEGDMSLPSTPTDDE